MSMAPNERESRQLKQSWHIHAIAILAGLALGLLTLGNPHSYSWVMSIAVGIGSVGVTGTIAYRKFANSRQFWKTIVFLLLLQIPIVIAARPVIERYQLAAIATLETN